MVKAACKNSKLHESSIKSWEDVEKALKTIADYDECIQFNIDETNKQINAIKTECATKTAGYVTQKAQLINDITVFAENNNEYKKFGKKELKNGTISNEIYIKSKAAVVNSLRELNLKHCIITTEEPDKEAMLELDSETLTKCGAGIKVKIEIK